MTLKAQKTVTLSGTGWNKVSLDQVAKNFAMLTEGANAQVAYSEVPDTADVITILD